MLQMFAAQVQPRTRTRNAEITPDAPLRVLLVQDSQTDAQLMERELSSAGMNVVTERVDTKEDFVRALHAFAPDVVLSDPTLPQFSAIDALQIVRAVRPATAMIVVSSALEDRSLVACMRAGADDIVCLSKLSGMAERISEALALRRPLERLTTRQLEVLRLVAEGLTTPQIAQRLTLSVKTIETHRSEVMKRLGVHDVVSLVRYAVRVGLVPIHS